MSAVDLAQLLYSSPSAIAARGVDRSHNSISPWTVSQESLNPIPIQTRFVPTVASFPFPSNSQLSPRVPGRGYSLDHTDLIHASRIIAPGKERKVLVDPSEKVSSSTACESLATWHSPQKTHFENSRYSPGRKDDRAFVSPVREPHITITTASKFLSKGQANGFSSAKGRHVSGVHSLATSGALLSQLSIERSPPAPRGDVGSTARRHYSSGSFTQHSIESPHAPIGQENHRSILSP